MHVAAAAPPTEATGTTSGARVLVAIGVGILAVQLVFGGVDLLLAEALDHLVDRASVTTYGLITGVAALVALGLYPVAGFLSDHTPAGLPRRSTWVLAGAGTSGVAVLALGGAGTATVLGIAYVVGFGLLPLLLVPLYATVPDRVPVDRRGLAGTIVGAATIVGGIVGNLIAAAFVTAIPIGALSFAAILVTGALAFVVLSREPRRAWPAPAVPQQRGDAVTRDFRLFAAGRFALFLGYAAVTALAYYIWRDYLGQPNPAAGVATFAIVSGGATLVAAVAAGFISDRVGARRPFVVFASALLALGLVLPVASPSSTAFLFGGALIGLGFGVYLSVGTALATLVLPNAAAIGRDVGLLGAANASAQVVAPIVGSVVATALGYPIVLLGAAAACLMAAVTNQAIRGVR